jgi:LuxR family transcriptional regulator, maltose regulon positive regulatory protein
VWAQENSVSIEDELSYLREFEHITLAMVLFARRRTRRVGGSIHNAARLLQRLLTAAEAAERTGSVIEILVLQALTEQARGDVGAALASLERAVTLAEPEGYIRVFVSHGAPAASLLRTFAKQRASGGYLHRLLNATVATGGTVAPIRRGLTERQGLIEPLSERELDVLRLLGSDLSGPDIARELLVSLNTLRTHTKSIYTKLGVNSRRAAVREAAQLNLLSRSHRK